MLGTYTSSTSTYWADFAHASWAECAHIPPTYMGEFCPRAAIRAIFAHVGNFCHPNFDRIRVGKKCPRVNFSMSRIEDSFH